MKHCGKTTLGHLEYVPVLGYNAAHFPAGWFLSGRYFWGQAADGL